MVGALCTRDRGLMVTTSQVTSGSQVMSESEADALATSVITDDQVGGESGAGAGASAPGAAGAPPVGSAGSGSASAGRVGKQAARVAARRTALDAQDRLRRQRAEREARLAALAVRVAVAVGERDAVVAAREVEAGRALREMTHAEGMALREAVAWCGVEMSLVEARRLLRSAEDGSGPDGAGVGDTAVTRSSGSVADPAAG